MNRIFICFFYLFAIFFAGCTTNPDTGEQKLFGVVPVETVVDVVEPVADKAKGSGGILGIIGTVLACSVAYWRRRKELSEKSNAEKAKAVAVSVIDGVDAIIAKINEAKANGGFWVPTTEELVELLKAAQTSAGTRTEVKQLIAEKRAST